MFNLTTAFIWKRNRCDKFDNLYQTGLALNADFFEYENIDIADLGRYQLIIIVDNKDYRILRDIPIRIRKAWPGVFMGFHQESEVQNIFYRQSCHGDSKARFTAWNIGILKVHEFVSACDFVICHNEHDHSFSFYDIFAGKPCICSRPFVPLDALKDINRPDSRNKLLIGASWNLREGGFLGYLVARGFDTEYELCARRRGRYDEQSMWATKTITDYFKSNVKIEESTVNRLAFAKLAAGCIAGIYLMEPTACRTNAICAAVGTPLISYERSTAARIVFPDLLVDKYDLRKARKLLNRLLTDEEFWLHCSHYAQKKVVSLGAVESGAHLRKEILKLWNARKPST